MSVHTPHQVAAYWVSAGGPKSRSVEWVAIANTESGWNDSVVSPAGAIGLWQIMPFNAHLGGGTVADLYDPEYNARVAVFMSSSGANCAAWDSCYLDIYASGRLRYLSYPQPRSAAWHELDAVAAALGADLSGGASVGSEPTLADGLAQAVADVRVLAYIALPNLSKDMLGVSGAVNKIYQRGWRAWGT